MPYDPFAEKHLSLNISQGFAKYFEYTSRKKILMQEVSYVLLPVPGNGKK